MVTLGVIVGGVVRFRNIILKVTTVRDPFFGIGGVRDLLKLPLSRDTFKVCLLRHRLLGFHLGRSNVVLVIELLFFSEGHFFIHFLDN